MKGASNGKLFLTRHYVCWLGKSGFKKVSVRRLIVCVLTQAENMGCTRTERPSSGWEGPCVSLDNCKSGH